MLPKCLILLYMPMRLPTLLRGVCVSRMDILIEYLVVFMIRYSSIIEQSPPSQPKQAGAEI